MQETWVALSFWLPSNHSEVKTCAKECLTQRIVPMGSWEASMKGLFEGYLRELVCVPSLGS